MILSSMSHIGEREPLVKWQGIFFTPFHYFLGEIHTSKDINAVALGQNWSMTSSFLLHRWNLSYIVYVFSFILRICWFESNLKTVRWKLWAFWLVFKSSCYVNNLLLCLDISTIWQEYLVVFSYYRFPIILCKTVSKHIFGVPSRNWYYVFKVPFLKSWLFIQLIKCFFWIWFRHRFILFIKIIKFFFHVHS